MLRVLGPKSFPRSFSCEVVVCGPQVLQRKFSGFNILQKVLWSLRLHWSSVRMDQSCKTPLQCRALQTGTVGGQGLKAGVQDPE